MSNIFSEMKNPLGYPILKHKMKNIYKYSAHIYDEGTDVKIGKDDIRFYLREISDSDNVLEIGCGTGRVAIELAKRGNKVTGLDLSENMLDIFQQKISAKDFKGNISIVQSDMSSFELEEKFDWIIFPFRAFQSLTNHNQRIDCLNCVKNHLKASGNVIIQMFNPNPEIFDKWNTIKNFDFKFWSDTMKRNIERHMIGEEHSKQEQTIKYHYLFKVLDDKNAVLEEFKEPMKLGYLFNEQALEIFNKTGFQVKGIYSDWKKSPPEDNNKKELIYQLIKDKTLGNNG